MSQLLVIVLLFLLGVFFNLSFGKDLPLMFIFASGFLSGCVLWILSGMFILLIGIKLTFQCSIILYLLLFAALVSLGILKKAFNKSILVWLIFSMLILAGITIFFIYNNYSTGFFDSLLLITQGKNLVFDGLSKFYESSPRGFGIFIPILQSGSVYCSSSYLQAVQPVMTASFILTFIFNIYHSASKIYNKKKIMIVVIALFIIFFITNQFIVFNLPLIMTNFPSAIYLFISISTYWLAISGRNRIWLIFTVLSLIAFSLLRTEGPVFGLVFLAILISDKIWTYPDRIKISLPYLIAIILWYTRIYFIKGVKYDIVNSNIIMLIIGVHVIFLIFIILSKYSLINLVQLNLHRITLFILTSVVLIYFIFHLSEGVVFFKNILLPMFIWGGWGFFYVFVFLFFLIAYFMPVFNNEKVLILVLIAFYLLLFIMEIGNGGYRVSGGVLNKWSGSGNRMSLHIIPLLIYYFILKFGLLFNPNEVITNKQEYS